MTRSGNNTLIGSGRVVEEKAPEVKVDTELGWPKRLYHPDTGKVGKRFETLPEQDEAKKEGWVESPADFGKVVSVEEKVKKEAVKGLKIDLSGKTKKE